MQAGQITYQTPRPEVKIYDRKSDTPKLEFDTSNKKILREYSFRTSVDDVKGHFSLTFYPDEGESIDSIFDQIKVLDIVEIYESKNHFEQGESWKESQWVSATRSQARRAHRNHQTTEVRYHESNPRRREYRVRETVEMNAPNIVFPTFVGVVRSKKYASQKGTTSTTRKLVVTGHSIVGLIAEFFMNMDTNAIVITNSAAQQEAIRKALTISILEGNNPRNVKEVITIIWNEFVKLSKQYGELSNPAIFEILSKWAPDFFDIDERLTFFYPLGNVFNARNTQGFFDIIEGILPAQVYEKFAYMDYSKGTMRLKIRECPFDAEDWEKLKDHECYEIPLRLVKSVDAEQNDNEVYTVFFSYLDGYPVQMQTAIVLAVQSQDSNTYPGLKVNNEKYSIYGYRPLFVSFNGYSKREDEEDSTTEEHLQRLNQRLLDWYGDLELMYNGQLAMSTDLSMDMPQAGETIAILGGEFYVTASEHRWNYKGNPETILTISRGGDYSSGAFSELKYWERVGGSV